jgi:hypothetical protein
MCIGTLDRIGGAPEGDRSGSALTFVRWLPVPYSRNSKKTALGIGLWRYAGIGIKPNDLPEDGEQARGGERPGACLPVACNASPCRNRGAVPCPPPALMPNPTHINTLPFWHDPCFLF